MDKWLQGSLLGGLDINSLCTDDEVRGLLVEDLSLQEFLVNAHSNDDQYNAQATVLCDRSHVVTWQCFNRDQGRWSVHGQRYDPMGEKLGEGFTVANELFTDQFNPSVSALCYGGFVVTWQSFGGVGDNWNSGIYGQLMDLDCKPVGNVFQVAVDKVESHEHPTVSTLCDGGFVVTWNNRSDANSRCQPSLRGRRFNAQAYPLTDALDARVDQNGALRLRVEHGLTRIIQNNTNLTGYSLSALLSPGQSDYVGTTRLDETIHPLCFNHHRLEAHTFPCDRFTGSARKQQERGL